MKKQKIIKKLFGINNLLLLTIVSNPVYATELVKTEQIHLQEYLQQIKTRHPFFKQQDFNQRIEQAQQDRFQGNEDWVIKANTNARHNERSPGNNAFVAEQQDNFAFNTGVERRFWSNGSRLSIDYDFYHSDQQFSPPIGAIDEYNNGIKLTYTVPLMKNRGGILSRLDYQLQAYTISYNKLNSLEIKEQFLEQQGLLFLDWVYVSEQRRIANTRLDLAEQQLIRTQKKRLSKLVEKVDVLRAKDAVIKAQQNLSLIHSQWRALQAQLATQISNPDLYRKTPTVELYTLKSLPQLSEVLKQLKQNARLLRIIDIQISQTKHLKQGFNNKLKPDLNLTLSSGLSSQSNDSSKSTKFDQPQYSIAVNFRYPLGQRTAKSDVLKTLLQQQQLRELKMDLQTQLEAKLRNLLTRLTELVGVINLNKEQITVARLRTEEELKSHNQGRSELNFVIQSRDNEQNAQLAYAANAATYQKLYLWFEALTDTLLANSNKL